MAVQLTTTMALTGLETAAGEFVDPTNPDFTVNGLNFTDTLTAATTPPVTMQAAGTIALVAGAATLDLTSLPDYNGTAGQQDGTGLKVQRAIFHNPPTNANDVTIVQGAANAYGLLGATFSITLAPDQKAQFDLDDASPDVASGAKNIDISGTGSQELDYHIVLG